MAKEGRRAGNAPRMLRSLLTSRGVVRVADTSRYASAKRLHSTYIVKLAAEIELCQTEKQLR